MLKTIVKGVIAYAVLRGVIALVSHTKDSSEPLMDQLADAADKAKKAIVR